MTFSDALPVQFWLADCDTYNEEVRFGQYSRCFCAPWECEDEIFLQFQDDEDQDLTLLIYDDEDSLLDEIPIDEVQDGVYQVTFIPAENTPDICDKNVKMQIRRNAGQQGVESPALNTWANAGGSGDPWTTGATPSINTSGGLGTTSEIIFVDYAFIVGLEYRISVDITAANSSVGVVEVFALNGSNVSQFQNSTVGFNSGTQTSDELTFVATANTTRIGVSVTSGVSANTLTIIDFNITRQTGEDTIVAKSDCLSIKEEQVGTILLTYSNRRNYAGVINNNGSPEITFNLRIPAVFNEEKFPETDEVEQLSNNRFISLNSQVKAQRRLETDQLPNYMRRKLKLVLKHQFLTIEDKDYVKEEELEELENSNKRWPMRRMSCWLTEKEYVIRNIL